MTFGTGAALCDYRMHPGGGVILPVGAVTVIKRPQTRFALPKSSDRGAFLVALSRDVINSDDDNGEPAPGARRAGGSDGRAVIMREAVPPILRTHRGSSDHGDNGYIASTPAGTGNHTFGKART